MHVVWYQATDSFIESLPSVWTSKDGDPARIMRNASLRKLCEYTQVMTLSEESDWQGTFGTQVLNKSNNVERFRAVLANGVTVELLGICERPSQGRTWWTPDGQRLDYTIKTLDKNTYPSDDPGYELIFRKTGDADFKIESIKGSNVKSGLRVIEPEDLTGYRAHIKKGYKKTNIKIASPSGKWKTAVTSSGKGSVSGKIRGKTIVFAGAEQAGKDVIISCSDVVGYKNATRIIAVDPKGKELTGQTRTDTGVNNLRQRTIRFSNLDLSDIAEFRFQTCPYEYYTFKNVSLKPNLKTDVHVEVEESKAGTVPVMARAKDVGYKGEGGLLAIRLVGVRPDGGDDIYDANGKKIAENTFANIQARWSKDRQYRTFIFELPVPDDQMLFTPFLEIRPAGGEHGLSTGQRHLVSSSDGKLTYSVGLTFPRRYKKLFTKRIKQVDLTLRYYYGPRGKADFVFKGPFTAGQTVKAEGGANCELTTKEDRLNFSNHPAASFRVSSKTRFDDDSVLVYDVSGRRHLPEGAGGRSGQYGSSYEYRAEGLTLDSIAYVTVGEKPYERTFENVVVYYRGQPARQRMEYLDRMCERLGLSGLTDEQLYEHKFDNPADATKVIDIVRGQWHVRQVFEAIVYAKPKLDVSTLDEQSRQKIRQSAKRWAAAGDPRIRAMGIRLGLCASLPEFVDLALASLNEDGTVYEMLGRQYTDYFVDRVRGDIAGQLANYTGPVEPGQLEAAKNIVLLRDHERMAKPLLYFMAKTKTEEGFQTCREAAQDDRPWIWWPAMGNLLNHCPDKLRPFENLPEEMLKRLTLVEGDRPPFSPLFRVSSSGKDYETLAGEAYSMLPGLYTPELAQMNGSVCHRVREGLAEHVDRELAERVMVEFLRRILTPPMQRLWAEDNTFFHNCCTNAFYIARQFNRWYGVDIGNVGTTYEEHGEPIPHHIADLKSLIGETLQWYESRSNEADKAGGADGKTAQSPFKATLANGVTVELVGVCEHPSEGRQWWRPDGSPLKEAPYDDDFGRAFPKDGEKGYKFAVKFAGMAGKEVDVRITPTNSKSTNGGALFSTSEKNGKENTKYVEGSLDEEIVWLGAAFDEELRYCDIRIGVCWGDWKSRYQYETDRPADPVEWIEFKDISLRPGAKTYLGVKAQDVEAGRMGAVELNQLIEKLSSSDGVERAMAAYRLGEMGEKAAAAAPQLIELLKEGHTGQYLAVSKKEGSDELEVSSFWTGRIITEQDLVRANSSGSACWVAAAALRQIGRPAVPALIEALKQNSYELRMHVCEILGDIGDPSAFEALLEMMKDRDYNVSARAIAAVRKINHPDTVERLIEALKDDNQYLRQSSAEALGYIKDAKAVGPLIDTLKDKDENVRINAAKALAWINDPRALEPLLEMLRDQSEYVRPAVAGALGSIDNPQVIEKLIDVLGDEQESMLVRGSAAKALGNIGRPQAAAPLIRFLHETKPDDSAVRGWAVEALGKIAHAHQRDDAATESSSQADMTGALITALSDADGAVRWRAATALVGLKDPRALEPLIANLKYDHINLRAECARALGEIGDRRAVPPLIGALKDDYWEVRAHAAKALGKIGDMRAAVPLIQLLNEDNEVSAKAAGALGRIGDARAIEPLITSLGRARMGSTKQATAEALKRLTGQDFEEDWQQWHRWWQEQQNTEVEVEGTGKKAEVWARVRDVSEERLKFRISKEGVSFVHYNGVNFMSGWGGVPKSQIKGKGNSFSIETRTDLLGKYTVAEDGFAHPIVLACGYPKSKIVAPEGLEWPGAGEVIKELRQALEQQEGRDTLVVIMEAPPPSELLLQQIWREVLGQRKSQSVLIFGGKADTKPLGEIALKKDSAGASVDGEAGEDVLDAKLEEMIENAVRQATSEVTDPEVKKSKESYQRRWYRETYLVTRERLRRTRKPRTVHGRIGFQELYESVNEATVVVATRNDETVSCSMIVEGAYSLGQLEPGTYKIYLNETSKTPGIMLHAVEVAEDQNSLPIDFQLGRASVSVQVFDGLGNPVESDDVELLIGGTGEDIHTWKKAKGIERGLWEVDHLYEGQYFVKAKWAGETEGHLCELFNGRNEVELSFKKSRPKMPGSGTEPLPASVERGGTAQP
ncbi:MAG: HEAT repeat domain-containing protein [Planctomycetota bacterium]